MKAKQSEQDALVNFYEAWKAHIDAGFARTREEVDKVAEMFGVKAPPFADPDGDTWASIFAALSATPVGQEILAKIAGSIGAAEPPRHPADVAYISILEARSIAMEELLGINSLTEWAKVGDGIAVPNIDAAKDEAYIDRVIARIQKSDTP